jgi:hypothetical protein
MQTEVKNIEEKIKSGKKEWAELYRLSHSQVGSAKTIGL